MRMVKALKIKEFAVEKRLTQGAVYKAIQRAGYSMKELTDRNGNITEAGFAILASVYPDVKKPVQNSPSERLNESKPDDSLIDDLKARLSEAEKALAKSETALKAETEQRTLFEKLYNETKDELREQRISAEKEREQYKILIRAEQGLRMKAERSLFQRVKVFFLGEKNSAADSVDAHGEVK